MWMDAAQRRKDALSCPPAAAFAEVSDSPTGNWGSFFLYNFPNRIAKYPVRVRHTGRPAVHVSRKFLHTGCAAPGSMQGGAASEMEDQHSDN